MALRDRSLPQTVDRALARLNARCPWSHNDHYFSWILGHLPSRRRGALDIVCGQGKLLALLAGEFAEVHGTDTSAAMRSEATRRCAGLENIVIDAAQLVEIDPATEPAPIDLITMVAVLHHLDLDATLTEAARLLAPGGRLLVVGLAIYASRRDYLWAGISAATNPVIGMVKNASPRRRNRPTDPARTSPKPASDAPDDADPFPVKDPRTTFDEVAEAAARHLPGARMRHGVGFRYTLEWTKPGGETRQGTRVMAQLPQTGLRLLRRTASPPGSDAGSIRQISHLERTCERGHRRHAR